MAGYPDDLRRLVEDRLEQLSYSSRGETAGLEEAMRYSLLAGGKRIRPVLCLATARALGMDPEFLLPTATALELIHTYSLIHDDLPAMDDDDLRRGRPTSHVAHGEDVAILAGDALFAEAIRLACEQRGEPARVLAAVREIAAATGVDGMVGGQYVDVVGGGGDPDALRLLHSLKTGKLISASVCSALALAGRERGGGGPLPALRDRARPPVSDRRRHPRRDRQRRAARQAERLRRAPREGHLREPLRDRSRPRAGDGIPPQGARVT